MQKNITKMMRKCISNIIRKICNKNFTKIIRKIYHKNLLQKLSQNS